MRKIGTVGGYTLIEDGFWVGTIDDNGTMHISPELHYRTISDFVDGVAIASQSINPKEANKWGLIDTEGNHVSEFKYSFVTEWGEGYYKCEIGNKKNLLRKDGTEVLETWFNDVFKVTKGLFIIGNTIRKTKDHPTLYPEGLAAVNGDILFPPMFNVLRWHDEVKLDYFYAELKGKPYLITQSGFIIDPAGDHLPKPSDPKDNFMWDGPKDTVCDGCIFTDGINKNGEGCRKLQKEDFRNNVIKGRCEHYKQQEQDQSYREKWDKYNEEKANDKTSKITEVYATNLVKDFIKDKLDGDVMKLVTFNFNELRGDEKYGNCGGFAFSPEKTSILKSIMTLTFSEAWPEISYDGFDHYDYEVAVVNTCGMLLGYPIGETFKGMQKFRPSAEMLDRAWAFYNLCHTIGNFMAMPGGMSLCRDKIRRNQRYIDTYLQAIHLAFTNVRRGNIDILNAINNKKKIYAPYRSDEGFTEMCKNLILDDYLDYIGNPIPLFSGVWSDQQDLTRDSYFKAVEQYFDFCETVIPKRAKKIISRLMQRLDMASPTIEAEKIMTIEMPKDYDKLCALPEDPKDAVSYGKNTPSAMCFAQIYPIEIGTCMPFDDIQPIVDGIHKSLADNQGIVEIVNGKTRYDKQFAYSIVKSGREPHGMNYILTMHIAKQGKALCLKGQFEERGTTGIRDATVYEYARRQGLIKEIGGDGWFKDPYDATFTKGLRMNLSEQREYDSSFREHPLSQLRILIAHIIEYN